MKTEAQIRDYLQERVAERSRLRKELMEASPEETKRYQESRDFVSCHIATLTWVLDMKVPQG